MSELPTQDTPNDAPETGVTLVVETLAGLDPQAIKAALNQKSEETFAVDPKAGIIIAPLEEVAPTDVNGLAFRYYGARILPVNPAMPNYVNPHVHERGQEPYLILDGTDGEMNTGKIVGDRVVWDPPRPVHPGETIIVEEHQVHSLRNTGDTTFDFAFASPDSHLTDKTAENPEGDRVFTADLADALPPQYLLAD